MVWFFAIYVIDGEAHGERLLVFRGSVLRHV